MTTQTLVKKIADLEKKIDNLTAPKKVLGKIRVDEGLLKMAKKAVFDFDIEKFVSPADVKKWKSS